MVIFLKRSWAPLIFFVFLLLISFFIFFNTTSFEQRVAIEPEPGCVVIRDSGNYDNNIDIVFIPENYLDFSKFITQTEVLVDTFLKTIPYDEYNTSFNFFRLESQAELGCDYSNDAVVCDPGLVKGVALKCPSDYPIVLVEINGIQNFFYHLRSSAWRGIASLNSQDDPLVFSHEFAHLFVGLLDEYTWPGGRIIFPGPNCDSDKQSCPKFEEVEGSECHIGCVNNENSRSVEIGIMRDYWISNRYGVFNENIIRKILESSIAYGDAYTNILITEGSPLMSPEDILEIMYTCYSPTDCEITGIINSKGYIPNYKNDKQIGDYQFEIFIEVDGLEVSQILTQYAHVEGHNENGEMIAEDIYFGSINEIFIIRQPTDQIGIELKDSDGVLLSSYKYYPLNNNKDSSFFLSGSKKEIEINSVSQLS